jgi:gamma-glutamylcyclotransferase (GGCT)/AIG2-like uncharacterized protein YtfP
MKVFIYGTLKRKKILEEALGEKHGKTLTKAYLPGYKVVTVKADSDTWPSIQPGKDVITGDVIDVTVNEFDKLKRWEDHYMPHHVTTTKGEAMTFIFEQP